MTKPLHITLDIDVCRKNKHELKQGHLISAVLIIHRYIVSNNTLVICSSELLLLIRILIWHNKVTCRFKVEIQGKKNMRSPFIC